MKQKYDIKAHLTDSSNYQFQILPPLGMSQNLFLPFSN